MPSSPISKRIRKESSFPHKSALFIFPICRGTFGCYNVTNPQFHLLSIFWHVGLHAPMGYNSVPLGQVYGRVSLSVWPLAVVQLAFTDKLRLTGREWTIFHGWTKWKSWKFSFSRNARIHRSRHRGDDCCHATPWRQQPRTAQARGTWMTRQHTEDRQLLNWTFPTSRAHRGSLSKRRELVLSSLPTPPPPPSFSQILGPRSLRSYFLVFALQRYVSYVRSHHFPWLQPHELQNIRFSQLTAIRAQHPMSHVSLGEAPSRLPHTVFRPKGLLLSGQGGCSRRLYQG